MDFPTSSSRTKNVTRRGIAVSSIALALGAVGPAAAPATAPAIRLGGTPLQLLAARDLLWVLTCDHGCAGSGRRSVGRVIRIDPRRARILATGSIDHPGAIAVAQSVFATDFWRHEIRRLDLLTLRQTGSLKLALPADIASRSRFAAFLPIDVAVGERAVWIATEWCAVARTDSRLNRVTAAIRLPCDAYQTMAFGAGSLWVSESLAGLYRVDPERSRVAARIRIGPPGARLVVTRVLFDRGRMLAIGARTQGGGLTGANALARIDPRNDRALTVTALPAGPLIATLGAGSLWVARANGSLVERPVHRYAARVGTTMAFAGGHLWTTSSDGVLRRLQIR
jgi:hypothetical protein